MSVFLRFRVGFSTVERNLTIPLTTLPLSPNYFLVLAAAAILKVIVLRLREYILPILAFAPILGL
ncbi:MAG: hypothetical protein MUF87_04990 [Anaerolineae bacterium]|nr:hypothetical protein [Anaerolineae bacterium]